MNEASRKQLIRFLSDSPYPIVLSSPPGFGSISELTSWSKTSEEQHSDSYLERKVDLPLTPEAMVEYRHIELDNLPVNADDPQPLQLSEARYLQVGDARASTLISTMKQAPKLSRLQVQFEEEEEESISIPDFPALESITSEDDPHSACLFNLLGKCPNLRNLSLKSYDTAHALPILPSLEFLNIESLDINEEPSLDLRRITPNLKALTMSWPTTTLNPKHFPKSPEYFDLTHSGNSLPLKATAWSFIP